MFEYYYRQFYLPTGGGFYTSMKDFERAAQVLTLESCRLLKPCHILSALIVYPAT